MKKSMFLLFIIMTISTPSLGEVYEWIDENGVRHFTNNPPIEKEVVEKAKTVAEVEFDEEEYERRQAEHRRFREQQARKAEIEEKKREARRQQRNAEERKQKTLELKEKIIDLKGEELAYKNKLLEERIAARKIVRRVVRQSKKKIIRAITKINKPAEE